MIAGSELIGSLNVEVDTGRGKDRSTVMILDSELIGSLNVDVQAGAGADDLFASIALNPPRDPLGGPPVFALQMDAGAGNDTVRSTVNAPPLGPNPFQINLYGGPGDDVLNVFSTQLDPF